jgi:hypothetical protein
MLLLQKTEIKVNSNHLEYYKKLGYNPEFRKKLNVQVQHLPKNSRAIVKVACDKCKKEKDIQYRQYILKEDGNYYCSKCNPFKKKREYTEVQKQEMIKKVKKSLNKRTEEQEKNRLKKTKETKKRRYGLETYNNQKRKRRTSKNKYGSETYNNPEKRKQTCLGKYGTENFNNQDKKKETCLKKYGVEHSNHNEEIFNKIQQSSFICKKFKTTNLIYQGSYELDFLERFYDKIDIENGPSVKYLFEGKNKVYYSDFYIPSKNLIIEIKSSYFYNKDKEKVLQKGKTCGEKGYNYILIIDKHYDILVEIINERKQKKLF